MGLTRTKNSSFQDPDKNRSKQYFTLQTNYERRRLVTFHGYNTRAADWQGHFSGPSVFLFSQNNWEVCNVL
jgi:hypothetical protein